MALPPRQYGYLCAALLLAAIAGGYFWQRQALVTPVAIEGNNDYQHPAAYPEETPRLRLQQHELFSDPMNGLGLRYQDKNNPAVKIDVNIYPVGALSWVNNPSLLDDEASVVLADMDYLIREGEWQQRLDPRREPLRLLEQEGLLLHFKLLRADSKIYKIVFLLLQEDKFIKFTLNATDLSANALPQAQHLIEHLLPLIHAPPESVYVHNLRQQHQAKMKQKVQELLRQRQAG